MLIETLAINDKTRKKLIKSVKPFFKTAKQGTELNNVISEILTDKDLFLYMATHSIKDSGIILGRMEYFDDIRVGVPYGITYNFENPSLNIFTFKVIQGSQVEEPIKTLKLSKILPSKKSMGLDTAEHYSHYPNVNYFVNSLNSILQKDIEEQKRFWIDFNKPFI